MWSRNLPRSDCWRIVSPAPSLINYAGVADQRDNPKNLLTIDPDGRVTLEVGAQKRLAVHPGRYRVVPTTGELVILQRVAQEQRAESMVGAIAPGRVALAGEIDSVGGLVD